MTQQTVQIPKPLLIRPLRCECSSHVYCEVCKAIKRLGGVECKDGFVFDSADRRAMAVELLGDRFGSRYFEVL